jgi:hypothetical protein
MFFKTPPPEETLPEDRFLFKPVLGIQPKLYLALLYGFALAALLFFLFFYPGVTHPGSLLMADSEPRGAALRVDGVYALSTPGELFLPQGAHLVELVLPGFGAYREEIQVGGRLFASRFFPRRIYLKGKLPAEDPLEAFYLAGTDYAAWALTGEPTAVYQIPRSLSEGAYRAGSRGSEGRIQAGLEEALDASARFALTRAGLRDLLRARCLVDSRGQAPSPLGVIHTARALLSQLPETPGAAFWLGESLPPETAALLKASPWYAREAAEVAILEARAPLFPAPGGRISLGSLTFREIPGGSFVQGPDFPRERTLGDFYIAENPVPQSFWEDFLGENPAWGPERREELRAQGLAGAGYLSAHGNAPPGPVSALSWHAAEAFCRWLSGALPPGLEGWELRLPEEAEWEYALRLLRFAGEELPGVGSYWEWCADPYAPLGFLPALREAVERLGSPERSLRGGSWINPPGSVGIATRASLPPANSAPFVSFRPVIARQAAGGGRR